MAFQGSSFYAYVDDCFIRTVRCIEVIRAASGTIMPDVMTFNDIDVVTGGRVLSRDFRTDHRMILDEYAAHTPSIARSV